MAIWYDTREPIRCTVWHRAYACEALAEVLGMPAEDIWLEEVPVRAVIAIMALAKASTAPTTPPIPTIPPVWRWRVGSYVSPREALPLETGSKGVGAGVKAVSRARRLVLTAKFLWRNTRGQGQRANRLCEPPTALRH
jgi:hypothetical protein